MGQSHPSACIVGGGLSGLYLARELARRGLHVHLVERNDHLGGRILTTAPFECGAFRVHPSQARIVALCRDLDVELAEHTWKTEARRAKACMLPEPPPPAERNMTWFDIDVRDKGLPAARCLADADGYHGSTAGYSEMDPSMHVLADAGPWLIAPQGFSSIVAALEAQLRALPHVTIHTSTLVTDVACLRGDGYVSKLASPSRRKLPELRTDIVIFACPPSAVATFHVMRKFGQPLTHAVRAVPLHRVYGKVNEAIVARLRGVKVLSDTPLQQTLGVPDYDHAPVSDWVQVSYAEGDVAQFWNDLKLADPAALTPRLDADLRRVLDVDETGLHDVESHYWEAAFHQWLPAFGVPADEARVVVNQARVPRVYIAGEALSTQQAWMEGALETAELVLQSLERSRHAAGVSFPRYHTIADVPSSLQFVVVDGRLVDVSSWMRVHPGGCAAIQAHLRQDATAVWRVVHSPLSMPWRMLLSLQVGWVLKGEKF